MLKIGKYFFVIFIVICFSSLSSKSQNRLSIKSELNQKIVGVEEDFVYSLIIESSKDIDLKVKEPIWSDAIEFSHSSRSEQTTMEFVNGSLSTSKVKKISYILKAKKIGLISLPEFKVFIEDRLRSVKGLKVKVVKENRSKNQRKKRGISPLDSFFDNSFSFSRANRKVQKKDIFIKLEIDKSQLFLSEQVKLKWFLYSSINVSGISLEALPVLKNFWKKEVKIKKHTSERIKINNQFYEKTLIFSYIVSALKTGELNIDPLKIQAQVLGTSGFGFFPQSVKIESKNKKLFVVKLPESKFKAHFTGAVGDFQIKNKVISKKIQKEKIFVWQFVVQGLGNLEVFNFSNLKLGKDLELYDIQEKIVYFPSGISKKKIDLLIIPKKEGLVFLPEVRFLVFNPDTKSYYNLFTKEKTIFVKENPLAIKKNIRKIDLNLSSKKILKTPVNVTLKKNIFFKNLAKLKRSKFINFIFFKKYIVSILVLFIFFGVIFLFLKRLAVRKRKKLYLFEENFLNIRKNIMPIDEKKAARKFIDLTYWSLEQVKNKKYKFLSIDSFIDELPVDYQNKHAENLRLLLVIFEELAFSKKRSNTLRSKLSSESSQLHKLLKILLKYN